MATSTESKGNDREQPQTDRQRPSDRRGTTAHLAVYGLVLHALTCHSRRRAAAAANINLNQHATGAIIRP